MNLGYFDGTYCGEAVSAASIWTQWNLDPPVIVWLAVQAFLIRRQPAGLAAVAALAVAFLSPICALAAALFSARVVHHLLLIALAAPLLAVALPARRALSPGLPFALSTLTLWGWHLPAAYDLALGNMAVYWLMQASLLATSLVFWLSVLHPGQSVGTALLGVFGAYLQMALLGALLTFAPSQLYAVHAVAPLAWGLLPLEDQQLGGLIMWVPGGLPYLVILALLARRGWRAMGVAG
jgi:putative membrane protein